MAIRRKDELLHGAEAVWSLDEGQRPTVELSRMGPLRREPDGPFGFRFVGSEQAANPEELLAAALVTCYASSLTSVLQNQGVGLDRVVLRAVCVVHPEPESGPGIGWRLDSVELERDVRGDVAVDQLEEAGQLADRVCPISKALGSAVPVHRVQRRAGR